MDSLQELFNTSGGGDNWNGEDVRTVRTDNISSADSTTPPPQHHVDDKEDKKSANSIRGAFLFFAFRRSDNVPPKTPLHNKYVYM